ncbi:hypothetical protein NT2_13_00720 [Caenibius tardaugens NBRC 16725]|uniref:Uncharacterized protein n=1 Tax=Caenibius tardaugens NBRC 16725 TaxID=1219035 RepID=U2YPW9_9SPHN|nr:hypothetical protein [Caenibius tardaugens]AZI37887.1 hypothetical protein EGO55_19550 [Caenibius tardaugens NBRC 16725]GAD50985.1 hypothetical protein NT2_13_00720 [Caenibius tardaugens NBRC 16725]
MFDHTQNEGGKPALESPPPTIRVHPRERLLSLDAIDGLAECLNVLNLPRRKVVEWLTDTLYGWIEQGGVVLSGEGEAIDIYPGIIDDAHGDDGSAVWISEQRRRAGHVPQRRPRQSMLLRLQLYDAAFRIGMCRSIIAEAEPSRETDAPNA